MNAKRINKESLKEQVRNILYDKIVSGEFSPNERLKIIPIAKALDVSQAPVREAIQCLITSGHLEHIPNVGVRVKEFTKTEIQETYKVREALEIASLKNCKDEPQVVAENLERALKRMQSACAQENVQEYITHNNTFHRCLVQASKNGKMLEVWESLHLPLYMKQTLNGLDISLDDALPLHEPIIKALKNNNVEQAVKALEAHYFFV